MVKKDKEASNKVKKSIKIKRVADSEDPVASELPKDVVVINPPPDEVAPPQVEETKIPTKVVVKDGIVTVEPV